jgi:hypothetical protein
MAAYDPVWRVDFSLHIFSNGRISCSVLPVCTADGEEVGNAVCPTSSDSMETDSPDCVDNLLTVVITSSPVRSNPSTRMLLESLASLDRNGGLSRCRKLIMCDGFKVRQRSQRKLGVVTDDEADLYRSFVREVASLCREHAAFRRTRVVRLARRQGSAFAIREAVEAHVQTPFVIIVPHDCVIARPVRLDAVANVMHANPHRVRYVKLVGASTANYADAVLSQCTCAGGQPRPCGRAPHGSTTEHASDVQRARPVFAQTAYACIRPMHCAPPPLCNLCDLMRCCPCCGTWTTWPS